MTNSLFQNKRKRRFSVGVIGDGEIFENSEKWNLAVSVGCAAVDAGYRIVCGGLGGVMEAVCWGAHNSKSYYEGCTVGILPGSSRDPSRRRERLFQILPYRMKDVDYPAGGYRTARVLVGVRGQLYIGIEAPARNGDAIRMHEAARQTECHQPLFDIFDVMYRSLAHVSFPSESTAGAASRGTRASAIRFSRRFPHAI